MSDKSRLVLKGTAYIVVFSALSAAVVWLLNTLFPGVPDELWGDVCLLAIAVMMSVFGLTYGFRSQWDTNDVGKIFLWKSAIVSVLFLQVALSSMTSSEYPGRDYVRPILYTLGFISYIAMEVSLVRRQQADRARVREVAGRAES
ncbi:membrane protein [Gordonia phage YungMoney]|nr:membrane protein [Gordonia phage YungMoney]